MHLLNCLQRKVSSTCDIEAATLRAASDDAARNVAQQAIETAKYKIAARVSEGKYHADLVYTYGFDDWHGIGLKPEQLWGVPKLVFDFLVNHGLRVSIRYHSTGYGFDACWDDGKHPEPQSTTVRNRHIPL